MAEILYDETQIGTEQAALFQAAADACLAEEGIPAASTEISLTFVAPEEIKDINREYREKDCVTDVLSFPQYEREELLRIAVQNNPNEEEAELLLGDVVICREKAVQQAAEFGHSEDRELLYLFVHSMLHLLGYDHMREDEKTEMRAKEEKIMTALGLEREESI